MGPRRTKAQVGLQGGREEWRLELLCQGVTGEAVGPAQLQSGRDSSMRVRHGSRSEGPVSIQRSTRVLRLPKEALEFTVMEVGTRNSQPAWPVGRRPQEAEGISHRCAQMEAGPQVREGLPGQPTRSPAVLPCYHCAAEP